MVRPCLPDLIAPPRPMLKRVIADASSCGVLAGLDCLQTISQTAGRMEKNTMSNYDEWNKLSARIRGLIAASELFAALFSKHEDALGTLAELGSIARWVTTAINTFGASLDVSEILVKRKISGAVDRIWTLIDPATGKATSSTPQMRQNCISAALVTLAALETEVSYLVSDRQSALRLRAE